jgi:ribosomal protein L29
MKLKDFKNEIKVLDITALIMRSKALKLEMSELILDKNINKIKNLKSLSAKRKDLARILTTLSQKQMIASLEPKEMVEEKKSDKVKESKEVKKGADKK